MDFGQLYLKQIIWRNRIQKMNTEVINYHKCRNLPLEILHFILESKAKYTKQDQFKVDDTCNEKDVKDMSSLVLVQLRFNRKTSASSR